MSTLSQLAGQPEPPPTLKKRAEGSYVDVIPYNAGLDPNASKFTPWFWERLKADGLIDLYFPGAAETGFAAFVSMLCSIRVVLVVLKNPEGEVEDTVGFATWEPMTVGAVQMGHAGFIFLRDWWDRETTVEAARRIANFWFTETQLSVMLGIVAKDNHLANRFLHRMEWTKAGTVPDLHVYAGKQSDAVIWYITRKQFEAAK